MSLDHMKIDLEGTGHLLGDKYLSVPTYQRSYAWEQQNVIDLIDDVRGAITEGHDEYFLGSIVLSQSEDGLDVVDGQQRLATTAIVIAAIRDWFRDNDDGDRADDVERQLLIVRDRRTQESRSRLRLGTADHAYFLGRVLRREDIPTSRPSHERIDSAATQARRRVDEIARASANPTETLLNWLDFLENSAKVIAVRVPTHSNAFAIFETLNDRGLGLSAADLLKNYLFMLAGDRLGEVQENWSRMLGALESIADESTVVTYIRHFWLSARGPARARDLYATIKAAISSKQSAIELAQALAENARNYAALLNPNHELWNELGGTGREHLRTLHFLRMEQNRPLLLAALKMLGPGEAVELLRMIVSWSTRFLIVGGLGGGTMEKHFGDAARAVRNGQASKASEVASRMIAAVPTDAQFKASFSTARVSQAWLARYYLRALEAQSRGESEPEVVPNENEQHLTLEHVLPKNPEAGWEHVQPEAALALHKRIGNLALMAKKSNSHSGNDPFSRKRPTYAASELSLTAKIAEQDTWGGDQIAARQVELAELAVITWRL